LKAFTSSSFEIDCWGVNRPVPLMTTGFMVRLSLVITRGNSRESADSTQS
jgi:hypothetical protein